jgi:hypothetical protein
MTVSVNPLQDFQRDQILTGAIRLCGLLTLGEAPNQDQINGALFHFRLALDELQSEGIVLTTVSRTTLALVAGQAEYPLPSDCLDVAMGQDDSIGSILDANGTVETIVKTMGRGEWMNIAIKTVQGRPSRCYIEKQNGTTAVFWPVPDASSVTFRYSEVRLLRDNDTGATTMDLRRTWAPYLTYATAVGVAFDNSKFDKANAFKALADAKLVKYKAGDQQQGNIRFQIRHSGRNW